MTSLTPRRDALIAATAEARTIIASLQPPASQVDAIGRELCPAVLEAALIPIAEAMDLGVTGNAAKELLVEAFANVIVSFVFQFCDEEERSAAGQLAQDFLASLVRQTRIRLTSPAPINVSREISDPTPERRQ